MSKLPWRKAIPGQIMGDGDEILAAIRDIDTGNIGYEILAVECDEHYLELVSPDGDLSDYSWSDIAYWIYTREIPGPEDNVQALKEAGK